MSQALDDLNAKVDELTAKETGTQDLLVSVQTSITDEIARLEAIIVAGQGSDDPAINAIAAKVQTAVDNLTTINDALTTAKTTLDAERPAPPPTP